MPDLTTRLLAEIERREGMHKATLPMRDIVDRHQDSESLAYLAALKSIVELHRSDCCDRCESCGEEGWGANFPCPTVSAIAEALGVDVG